MATQKKQTPLPEIPHLVKHMTVAIHAKGPRPFPVEAHLPAKAKGRSNAQFLRAFIIAVAKCEQWGYVAIGGEAGGFITLTGKGKERERHHRVEGFGKSASFDAMYKQAFATMGGDERKDPARGSEERQAESPVQPALTSMLSAYKKQQAERAAREKALMEPPPKVKKPKGVPKASERPKVTKARIPRGKTRRPPKGRI
jgi:hypothetical protein